MNFSALKNKFWWLTWFVQSRWQGGRPHQACRCRPPWSEHRDHSYREEEGPACGHRQRCWPHWGIKYTPANCIKSSHDVNCNLFNWIEWWALTPEKHWYPCWYRGLMGNWITFDLSSAGDVLASSLQEDGSSILHCQEQVQVSLKLPSSCVFVVLAW